MLSGLHLLCPGHRPHLRPPHALQLWPDSGSCLRSPSSASHSSTPGTQGRLRPCPVSRAPSLALSRLQPLGTAAEPRQEVGAYGCGRCGAGGGLGTRALQRACSYLPGEAHSRFLERFWHWWRGLERMHSGSPSGSFSCPGHLPGPGVEKPYFGAPLHGRFCCPILSDPEFLRCPLITVETTSDFRGSNLEFPCG